MKPAGIGYTLVNFDELVTEASPAEEGCILGIAPAEGATRTLKTSPGLTVLGAVTEVLIFWYVWLVTPMTVTSPPMFDVVPGL